VYAGETLIPIAGVSNGFGGAVSSLNSAASHGAATLFWSADAPSAWHKEQHPMTV
jgi:hypothetical protein